MKKEYIFPKKVFQEKGEIENSETLLSQCSDLQIGLAESNCAVLHCGCALVLDFGKEYCGGVRILTYHAEGHCRVRIRFGESMGEACSELGEKGSSNDHSLRDFETELVQFSDMEFGQTAYRFIRIDVLEGAILKIKKILGVFEYFDAPIEGDFKCSDLRLNQIFDTASYTLKLCVHNNMVWDGAKRDRLVWIGDMHPETLAMLHLYGAQDCIRNSLRFIREQTPLPAFMNGIPAYSLWWIIILSDYYLYTGDIQFLEENAEYLTTLVRYLESLIDPEGNICFPESPDKYFLDWATYCRPERQAGVYALFSYACRKLLLIADVVGIKRQEILELRDRIRTDLPHGNFKQVMAMQALGGHTEMKDVGELLKSGGADGVSAFMSYYIFHTLFAAGEKDAAIDILKAYFGYMLDLGATTFWEEFSTEWLKNCSSIDKLPKSGEKDIHGDVGEHCYAGYRRSLCHGWSAGAVPFLIENILGVKIIKPGFEQIQISPYLGSLEWAKGSIPTPHGTIRISVSKKNGREEVKVIAPQGIEISGDEIHKVNILEEI